MPRGTDALRDEARLAQITYWQGRLHYVLGDMQTALGLAERSLTLADRLCNDTLAALPVNLMGRLYFLQSDFTNASQMLARSVEQMRKLGNTSEETTAAAFAGAAFGFMGLFAQALPYAEHGIRLAHELQNPFARAAAYQYRGNLYNQRGTWQQAIADFTEARRIAEQTGDLFRDVLPLCQEALRLAEATNDRFAKAMALRVVAEVQIGLSAANVQPADEALVEAMQIHRHIGARPELARSYVNYAGLLRQTGEGEKARAWLRRAVDMFRQMDMTEELGRVEPMLRVS